MKSHLKNLKSLPFGGASCVIDSSMDLIVQQAMIDSAKNLCLNNLEVQDQFVKKYFEWIQSSQLNSFKNLDQFGVLSYSNGTTEGFDKFYITNHARRFRVFRGEYMYHGASWKSSHPDWRYIEDEPLKAGDAVICSMPFSDTGNVHPQLIETLNQCHKLNIPVLIDCAFVGICGNIEFDFDHPAVTDITFSLSKTFPVAGLRIGMRCRREDNDDGLIVHQKTNYSNRLGAEVGLHLLERYSVDYNFNQWRDQQIEFCSQLDLTPSNSVIFGLGDARWNKYNRGKETNRLCFSKWFVQKKLPDHD
jgi:histidinol-phosphate/aromatic aminotransferase/cobyric acid decarboxylase-like protein